MNTREKGLLIVCHGPCSVTFFPKNNQRMALLGDAPLRQTFPPIFLCHLCIFLLIVASPRRSALMAPIPESDGHMTQHSYHLFTILHLFSSFYYLSSFYYFNSNFLVYRHASHRSRVLSFSFRIPCQVHFPVVFMFIYMFRIPCQISTKSQLQLP